MAHPTPFKEELELDQLRAMETELSQRNREFEENEKQIARARREREITMPPLEDIADRERRKRHELAASRGEVENKKHVLRKSFLLLVLLTAATGSLLWWGYQLMQGV